MDQRLCQCCKRNHAARSYEGENKEREFYCLECYARLFLEGGEEEESSLSECPYCGMSLAEAKTGKLVGCAHCYASMQAGLYPMIRKMQGERAHRGKTPPLEGSYSAPYDFEDTVGAEYRAKAVERARFERQCRELQIIIKKLKAEGNFEDAKGYDEKLTAMKNRSAIEEDFVWRTRRSSSKQS